MIICRMPLQDLIGWIARETARNEAQNREKKEEKV